MKRPFISLAILALFSVSVLTPSSSSACTGITIKPKDGSVIFGRTLEFAMDLQSNVIIIPRNKAYVGSAPDQKQGLHWNSQYGMVGMNAFDLPIIADGINEKGLHVGIFYFPDYAEYQDVSTQELAKTISPMEVPLYLLGTCATVDEVTAKIKQIKVGKVVMPQMGGVPPFHYIVSDAGGKSIVLEYVNGKLNLHQNPLGVCTNAPTFDWHMTNLGNYVNLLTNNVAKIEIEGQTIQGLGQGSGMLGLPGDFTPPSRFVRAVAFSASVFPVDTAREGILQVFHVLNQFDIPKGAARGDENGKVSADYTLWTSVSDLKNQRYYFRTYDDSTIRMVNLNSFNLDGDQIQTISIQGQEQIIDVSGCAK
ncbi:choloylglycine hydrolase family protein [uncultured Gimesia sp.]|uniref:choloylglycine hydrolase family protein n=1 Tax=uncultured Gimesia sp. TaxID=1678688 RepID=UPI002607747B|nr:choloylglycine hydrolase family protein [uncultured Gimesia sp.]